MSAGPLVRDPSKLERLSRGFPIPRLITQGLVLRPLHFKKAEVEVS